MARPGSDVEVLDQARAGHDREMATIDVEDASLIVTMEGADKLWALRSRLEIPLAHVRGARADPTFARDHGYQGLKLGGARVPGVITAGTFRQGGAWVFWDVHDPDQAVVIDLADERYTRLVIGIDDPESAAAGIQEACGRA